MSAPSFVVALGLLLVPAPGRAAADIAAKLAELGVPKRTK
jgi:hypothetical protein